MQPTIRHILKNPYTFTQKITYLCRFIKWQFTDKILRKPLVFRFSSKSKLMLMPKFQALSGNYYYGIAEIDTMPFLLHCLLPGDLFADIGANGGGFTVLASAEKGAHTISVEAAPDIFEGLKKNIALNNLQPLVEAWNVAAADKQGTLPFTSTEGATNHVSLEDRPGIIQVPCNTLDHIFNGRVPLALKLDIEGYEHNALLGADKTLSSPNCKAIVIEFGNVSSVYGYGNDVTYQLLCGYGFKPCKYNYKTRELSVFDPAVSGFDCNMIYVKDVPFISERVKNAEPSYMSGLVI